MEVITVTKNGQITLPENLRQQLRLNEESKLSLKIEAGRLILTPITEDVELLEEDGILTFSATLTADEDINTLIEKLRY
ncbi:AbrB/MazE/SpoVT family DNA-binding domain-containing protein [Anabaena cylindrica FACHB-243]|jgi:AbrB family looped-hinge helix DNA binding protein|uniref:Transcriptional regulator, AbrB family n=1 Tax=Anabaena cylindrica (strain ATCC 27899 / PCC 7122) TaxID=272123 RepID=K9ZC88_ANACC|nr:MULTISPECIES: AbrB/MazE/SpoVT family DNA-binding domain-containing protein [Anabaena]AFZ56838.1 transcriptional regulator, AbrB family [Anabaena cylindrica PCC 7122]MBD2420142.1 AbrB/MazE/SpoVT family DNA-binding domain-containing protein [Anabaena cylindrica FACHB-243]MBY5285597.1 AbrB/MazE/SpoVT family DNA-binding domain-containing protein [Anabaena sp. CCAP 1446/1C]MBY5311353.1 AbrB/MazE/SpoVT family DNA-binding domain-containing protein [Anabaena sp. CCAP 1446/1C]MCM2410171.1 AbrB/MazE/